MIRLGVLLTFLTSTEESCFYDMLRRNPITSTIKLSRVLADNVKDRDRTTSSFSVHFVQREHLSAAFDPTLL